MFVVYKLPTVVISRRTDQYSKAYENLMGQQPQQGIPKARTSTLARAASGTPAAPQVILLPFACVWKHDTRCCFVSTFCVTMKKQHG